MIFILINKLCTFRYISSFQHQLKFTNLPSNVYFLLTMIAFSCALSPSQQRGTPFRTQVQGEGTNSARLFTPGERNALAKSKVHQILWAHGYYPRVDLPTDLKNTLDCHGNGEYWLANLNFAWWWLRHDNIITDTIWKLNNL
jgi:hypothetical protein